ncbi:MAG TPA: arginine--tRNA ligase [Alphaproteobacteria bacterium]|nr:arginine--tRNA ligase [Alphaproteobacteria bacterium]
MSSLTAELTRVVAQAFAACGLPPEAGQVGVSQRPDLCQFQCNGAMAAAKAAKANPRALAEQVVEKLRLNPVFSLVEIAGPGFINLSVTDAYLGQRSAALAEDARLGLGLPAKPQTVVVDYGGPNVAKAMHVGHLRSSIIGECLKRLFRHAGHKVVGDVHLGDWGLQMGQLIAEIAREQPDLPYFDAGFSGPYPNHSPVTVEDLERLYPQASARCKEDPEALAAARQATAELQAGRPGYRALWQHFFDVSVERLKADFGALGVSFDLWLGESSVHELIEPMVEGLRTSGVAEESEGALVVRVAREGDKAEIPPLILLKSDGAVMYGTTDLATILYRRDRLAADLVVYIVDQRQHLHFEQVFRAAERGGIKGGMVLDHSGFGTVNGADGKPFKTRAGGVLRLADLLAMATEQAHSRLREAGLATSFGAEEADRVARQVGIAAVKFADLMNHRLSSYVFDLDKFTRFEGKTGPYLQYTAVRIKSLLRNAEERGAAAGPLLPPSEAERPLVLALMNWPDAVARAMDRRAPNELCDYVFDLAQQFSRFYQSCHILSETDEAKRGSWLSLCGLTLRTLEQALDILGIEVPERM